MFFGIGSNLFETFTAFIKMFFIIIILIIKMANDKFILMGLDDDKTGDIAEVLKNKTCKKILNYLAEIKEVSEKDISSALKMPINTVEYNLKKLIKAGLVEKTKNFFWSVKGKKIPMYKLARKHIVISPNKTPSLNYLKNILPVVFIIAILAAFLALNYLNPDVQITDETKLRQFSSQTELSDFLKEHSESQGFWKGITEGLGIARSETLDMQTAPVAEMADSGAGGADDYSTTNIQVEGVDEADIVKNDGKYIYAVTGSKVVIVDAYPAEDMKILSEISLDKNIRDIFIDEDKLVVFVQGYYGYFEEDIRCLARDGRCGSGNMNMVYIYDISDKENPELEEEIALDGNYVNSRMIGDYVYVISTKYVNVKNPELPVYMVGGVETKVAVDEIYYWDYADTNYVFTSISAINVKDIDVNSEVFLTGASHNIFVSQNNIYLTYQKRMDYEYYAEEIVEQVYLPILPSEYDEKIIEILDSKDRDYEKLNDMQKILSDYSI
jgi:uncharacterized secreted protein with C-terminal beta-propeller domain